MEIDFDSFSPKSRSTSSSTLVFIKGKNTQPAPITVRPLGGIFVQDGIIYDESLKRNRKARPGEKFRTQYLWNGLDENGTVKTYVSGAKVIEGIKAARKMAAHFGNAPDIYVDISSTGSGLDTEYAVGPTTNKKLGKSKVDVSTVTKPDLAAVANSLLAADVPNDAPKIKKDDEDSPF